MQQSAHRHPASGEALAEGARARIRVLVDRVGERQACKQLEVSRLTLARALGGLGVRHGTAVLIYHRLDALDEEAAA